jgi:hypothetical protein
MRELRIDGGASGGALSGPAPPMGSLAGFSVVGKSQSNSLH